ncbi:hypothetical protein NCCP2495_05790 [Dietzia sp. NCCP-2495]|uniref:hypothetical protein n=1 Tax=Dietzia sp. NCCP-2495 TaxID=2934675 RepID=UPI00222E7489|nr:hypothetical protein [Dietzia sp. NCCP-2495]GLB62701.1 hypothetical protein NCCP2495_05790 [Dietzia sp. NCCP-2495]
MTDPMESLAIRVGEMSVAVDDLEYLLAALDSGNQWEIDAAVRRAVTTLNTLKDKPCSPAMQW